MKTNSQVRNADQKHGREILLDVGERATKDRPSTIVRVYVERKRVWLQYPATGNHRAKRSWPDSPANRTLAERAGAAAFTRLEAGPLPKRITLRELWEQFTLDLEAFAELRARTRALYAEAWALFVEFAGGNKLAASVTTGDIRSFCHWMANRTLRGKKEKKGHSYKTIHSTLSTVRLVFRFGEGAGLVPSLGLDSYVFKTRKGAKRTSPPEYSLEEWKRLLDFLDPNLPTQWRPWVVLALCGLQGARLNAVLHLRVRDIDLEAGTIRWAPEWDKGGEERIQPLSDFAKLVIQTALQSRKREGYTGEWLIPSRGQRKAETFSLQSVLYALKRAEEKTGVGHVDRRGAHGLRRLVAGDVAKVTGNGVVAMHVIGDKDLRQAKYYIHPREGDIRDAMVQRDESLEKSGFVAVFARGPKE